MLKKILKYLLKKSGLRIMRENNSLKTATSMEGALFRCKRRGLLVNSVIDVGASNGQWSQMCVRFLPDANYLLIEAQSAHLAGLEKFVNIHKNSEYLIAAAGGREGKIFFDNGDLFGGLASDIPFEKNCIEIPVVRIDDEVSRRSMVPPFLIKLDTHGFEVPILEGAQNTLKQSSLVIIETYNHQLTTNSLKYYEMCKYMENIGFFPIEMVDLGLRLYDNSLWQMDTFFIPKSSGEFSYIAYK